jgi:hypothetical protein
MASKIKWRLPATPSEVLDTVSALCAEFKWTSSFQTACELLANAPGAGNLTCKLLGRSLREAPNSEIIDMASQFVCSHFGLKERLITCDLIKDSYDEAQRHHGATAISSKSFDMIQWRLAHIRGILSEAPDQESCWNLPFQIVIKYGHELNDDGFVKAILTSIACFYPYRSFYEALKDVAELPFTQEQLVGYFDTVLEAVMPFMEDHFGLHDIERVEGILGLGEKVPSNAITSYCIEALEHHPDTDRKKMREQSGRGCPWGINQGGDDSVLFHVAL